MTQTSVTEEEVGTALAALRAMISIGDATLERATGSLTLTQFRALRVVVEHTPVTGTRVAADLGMNPSSVTRACDRLVTLGLLSRARNPSNRRETLLAPTAKGRQLAEQVNRDRRRVLAGILDRLDPDSRAAVVAAFALFTDAADGKD